MKLATAAAEGIQGSEQVAWLGRLDTELDNIRGALAWLRKRDRILEAQDLAGAVSIFLLIRAYYTEARALYESLVTHPRGSAPTAGRAWCLIGLGAIALNQGGDAPRSLAAFDESVAICRQIDARHALVWALTCRALPLMRTGSGAEAQADCTEAVALARDDGYRWGEAAARGILGLALHQRGDLEEARLQMQTSIDQCVALGESWVRSVSTGNLAMAVLMPRGELDLASTYLEEGDRLMLLVGDNLNRATSYVMRAEIAMALEDPATAEAMLREALATAQEMGDPYGTAHALRMLGLVAAEAGDIVRAVHLLRDAIAEMSKPGAADDMAACFDAYADVATRAGDPATAARLIGAADADLIAKAASRWDTTPHEHETRVVAIVAALGNDGYRTAWEAGHALSMEQAVSEALAWEPAEVATTGAPDSARLQDPVSRLTSRELEVLRLMAEGLTNQQIADRLFVSKRTATSHASNLLAKLDLPSRTAAVAWALRNGIA